MLWAIPSPKRLVVVWVVCADFLLLCGDRYLALICLMRKEGIEKKGLVDFNVQVFQNALQRVFEVGR